jgi:hypothetical protein
MASITASSAAVRAVAGRSAFLAGSSKVSAVAPRAIQARKFVVRAEGEVSFWKTKDEKMVHRASGATIQRRDGCRANAERWVDAC